jgi:hypothetical protein
MTSSVGRCERGRQTSSSTLTRGMIIHETIALRLLESDTSAVVSMRICHDFEL